MTPTPQAIENAARAIEEELVRDMNAWVERWTFPGGIYHDAPSPPTGRYRATPERIAKAALSADLGGMVLVPKEPTEAMLEAAVVAGHQANKPFVERIKSRSFEAGMSSDITAGDGRIYRAAYRAMIAAAEGERCK